MCLIPIAAFGLFIVIIIRLYKEELTNDLKAICDQKWLIIILLSLAVLVSFYVIFIQGPYSDFKIPDSVVYADYIDPIIAILTFVTALFLGMMGIRKSWEEQLPQRLAVHYVFNNQILGSFFNAHIVSKEDIRNQAQSLGKELLGGTNLNLTTHNDLYPSVIKIKKNQYYRHWVYVMRLNSLPPVFQKQTYQLVSFNDHNKPESIPFTFTDSTPYFLYTIDMSKKTKEAVKGYIFEFKLDEIPSLLKMNQSDFFKKEKRNAKELRDHKYSQFLNTLEPYDKMKTNYYLTSSNR